MMISSRSYLYIFLAITIWLGLEYASINHFIATPSLIKVMLKASHNNITTEPGKPLSYFLGWLGFITLCLTNLYVMRKRLPILQNSGTISSWLEFHIFCGMLGPILIIYHTNFKVGGLVAISFWSMIVSASSGVLGRYFYFQFLQSTESLRENIARYDAAFDKLVANSNKTLSPEFMAKLKAKVLKLSGVLNTSEYEHPPGLLTSLKQSMLGDLRLKLSFDQKLQVIPRGLRKRLRAYAVLHRRLQLRDQFKLLMGYWHSFHLPFAYFMYFVAIIHIFVVLLFRTHK